MALNENLPPGVMSRLFREMQSLVASPIDGVEILRDNGGGAAADSLSEIYADIEGPVGTPYEGGVFRMKLALSSDFPAQPPRGYFCTKIFHPNVSEQRGEICVDTLKRDWQSSYGLRHVLMVVRCLLIDPNPESALNEEAGRLLLDDYEEFAAHARIWTEIHAAKRRRKPGSAAAAAGTASDAAAAAAAAAVDSLDTAEASGASSSTSAAAKYDASSSSTRANESSDTQVMKNTGTGAGTGAGGGASRNREKRRSLKRL